jgi:non-specific serine/threonine protein kinase
MVPLGRAIGGQAADATSFVGRQAEVERVSGLLLVNRLVTLTGPGGAGKTRLALRVVAGVAPSFADGTYVVALDALQDPGLLTQVVASQLGLRDVPEEPVHSVTTFLRDRTLLLVLDNCEHMVDECGLLIGKVLSAAPNVRILTTSRHVLSIEGEHVFPVEPLPIPRVENGVLFGQTDALRLFADRASAASPGFEVTPANQEDVVGICSRLDGLPLAIELAAAWVRVLEPADILHRVQDRFAFLARGGGFKHFRQRTLLATVEWSYHLCSPEEQALWTRLSVFKGGFTLAAAETVCAGGNIRKADVLIIIASLVDKSLLSRDGHNGSARYWMLDTIHQYGHDLLIESGQGEEFHGRHCVYFLELIQAIGDDWYGERQLEHRALVWNEQANLRAALEFGLSSPSHRLDGAWLAVRLHFHWISCGFIGEGLRWLARVLALHEAPDDLRVHALWISAYSSAVLGDQVTALSMAEQGVALARGLGEAELLALSLYGEGTAALFASQYSRSDACYGESIAWYQKLENPGGRLFPPYHVRGLVAALAGDPVKAEELARRGLEHLSQRGEVWARSYAHYVMAFAHWRQDDLELAFQHATECIRLTVEFNDGTLIALVAEMLADAAMASGERSRAACLLGLVERTWRRVGGSLLAGDAAWLESHRAHKSELRKVMGDAAFTSAIQIGEAKGASLRTAADFLLQGIGQAADTTPLTRREMEVAVWVARGKTNKEIAATLSISPRTVEVHVDRIMRKLEFASRVQIGIWVASRGLAF